MWDKIITGIVTLAPILFGLWLTYRKSQEAATEAKEAKAESKATGVAVDGRVTAFEKALTARLEEALRTVTARDVDLARERAANELRAAVGLERERSRATPPSPPPSPQIVDANGRDVKPSTVANVSAAVATATSAAETASLATAAAETAAHAADTVESAGQTVAEVKKTLERAPDKKAP